MHVCALVQYVAFLSVRSNILIVLILLRVERSQPRGVESCESSAASVWPARRLDPFARFGGLMASIKYQDAAFSTQARGNSQPSSIASGSRIQQATASVCK